MYAVCYNLGLTIHSLVGCAGSGYHLWPAWATVVQGHCRDARTRPLQRISMLCSWNQFGKLATASNHCVFRPPLCPRRHSCWLWRHASQLPPRMIDWPLDVRVSSFHNSIVPRQIFFLSVVFYKKYPPLGNYQDTTLRDSLVVRFTLHYVRASVNKQDEHLVRWITYCCYWFNYYLTIHKAFTLVVKRVNKFRGYRLTGEKRFCWWAGGDWVDWFVGYLLMSWRIFGDGFAKDWLVEDGLVEISCCWHCNHQCRFSE